MASRNSYSYQIELLSKMKEQLEVFKEDISTVARNYKSSVQSLHDQEGLMDETYEEYYSTYVQPTIEYINNLIERMDTEDIAFVDKEISFLSSR